MHRWPKLKNKKNKKGKQWWELLLPHFPLAAAYKALSTSHFQTGASSLDKCPAQFLSQACGGRQKVSSDKTDSVLAISAWPIKYSAVELSQFSIFHAATSLHLSQDNVKTAKTRFPQLSTLLVRSFFYSSTGCKPFKCNQETQLGP